jgi:hypothetical protein
MRCVGINNMRWGIPGVIINAITMISQVGMMTMMIQGMGMSPIDTGIRMLPMMIFGLFT